MEACKNVNGVADTPTVSPSRVNSSIDTQDVTVHITSLHGQQNDETGDYREIENQGPPCACSSVSLDELILSDISLPAVASPRTEDLPHPIPLPVSSPLHFLPIDYDIVSPSTDAAIAAALAAPLPPRPPRQNVTNNASRQQFQAPEGAVIGLDAHLAQNNTSRRRNSDRSIAGSTSGSIAGSTAGLSLQSRRNREGSLMNKMFGNVVSHAPNCVPAGGASNIVDAVFAGLEAARSDSTEDLRSADDGSSVATTPPRHGDVNGAGDPQMRIYSRTLLPSSVRHDDNDQWIATLSMSQIVPSQLTSIRSASIALAPSLQIEHESRTFSFQTEREARATCKFNAPPLMIPFHSSPRCAVCNGKFAVFRRAHHCRNCGSCICQSCVVPWTSKAVPDLYNSKSETRVRICLSCDWITNSLMKSLLHGRREEARALDDTKNVNWNCALPKKHRDERLHPIHCAVLGGSLELLRWLIDEHSCPVFQIGNDENSSSTIREPIVSGKGRCVLTMAMEEANVDIVRYLVVQMGMNLNECHGLRSESVIYVLGKALHRISDEITINTNIINNGGVRTPLCHEPFTADTTTANQNDEEFSMTVLDYNADVGQSPELPPATAPMLAQDQTNSAVNDESGNTLPDLCILCCNKTIDCVITPCGHQVCCISCSKQLDLCPVCKQECTFLKIFKP